MSRPRAHPARHRRAFTLLEAIVGIAIIAALLGALGVFIRNLGDARARLATSVERIECADAVFALVDRAIATAVVADPVLGAGVGGNERMLRIVRATVGLGEGDAPLLAERERCEVRFDGGSGRIELARGDRRDAVEVPVRAMRVRYLVEDGWRDAFDSADSGAFPAGIEVSIWFARDASFGDASLGGGAGGSAGADASDGSRADTASAPTPLGAPDRRRFFRVPGAPRIDPLARRAIEDEEASMKETEEETIDDEPRDRALPDAMDGDRREMSPAGRSGSSRRGGGA